MQPLSETQDTTPPAPITLAAPAFDEEKLLIYRELYYDGFSSIIAARDLTTGAAVAVKKVEYRFFTHAPFPIRWLQRRYSRKVRQQTARIRTLSHNSLLKLIEFVVEPKRIVVVTEMCMFGDLFNWMLQQPQLRVRDLCLIIQYIYQVLRYLHSQNFVHGNLTPTHILFQAMSPQSVTIMPDLSIRKELAYITANPPLVIDSWAPEYIRSFVSMREERKTSGKGYVESNEDQMEDELMQPTKAMDVWGVGCIAHIALTGKPPYPVGSLEEVLSIIDQTGGQLKNPMISTFSDSVQKQLRDSLALAPEDRPNAEQFSELYWFDDDQTRSDKRNILLTIEYDLMHTCRRYRTQGRQVFDNVFVGQTDEDDGS
ncbi:hypothetical protein T265_01335 [Opisthorchis viverrini]|uniref:Protein kinase domain-containing protein n=1 Tax=Opisthorchis viverrini TaxID=6198 RepID=A0A074ZYY5_OPIVI|nr:hypothetical protein T265_01335 [Opisthorchis viverrini]KER32648.1 hypothetical protein T265_01335 [Opisthorchis viverrini]